MEWTREELKQAGRIAFSRNYGSSVLAAFIYSFLSGIQIKDNLEKMGFEIAGFMTVQVSLAALLLTVLVVTVFEVGSCRFFVENRDYNAPASKILFGFQCGHYTNVVWTMMWRNLKIFLWGLLLVIPGIVKGYEYRMVSYILAEQPDIDSYQAFEISRSMMMGRKADAFILDLSFIGWYLLSVITCNLSGIFWTAPYQSAVNAELYVTLRDGWMYRCGSGEQCDRGENF